MEETINPKCKRCNCFWKPDETDIKTSGLVYKTCKRCRTNNNKIIYDAKYRKDNAEKRKQYYKDNAEKIIEANRQYNKQYRKDNAEKVKETSRQYRKDNAEKIKEYRRQYRKDNAEKIKEASRQYYINNKDKIVEATKKYRKENMEVGRRAVRKWISNNKCEHSKRFGECKICNLPLYLLNLQRGQIRRCLKSSTQNKTKSSIEYLGCDADYFKDYIQKKMDIYNETAEVKMDFANIHIDHIKPVSSFNLDEEDEFLDCCNYTNFQPLLIKDNLSKNDKWTDDDNKYWNDNIKGKEHLEIYLKMI